MQPSLEWKAVNSMTQSTMWSSSVLAKDTKAKILSLGKAPWDHSYPRRSDKT